MERFGMPLTVSGLSADEIIETTKSDKKMDSGTIRFILLEEQGQLLPKMFQKTLLLRVFQLELSKK